MADVDAGRVALGVIAGLVLAGFAFYGFYGSLHPCDALATALSREVGGGELGALIVQGQISVLTPGQCIEGLWRLETEGL